MTDPADRCCRDAKPDFRPTVGGQGTVNGLVGAFAVLLLLGAGCDRQSAEPPPIVNMTSLVEEPFAWDGKEISVVGMFEYDSLKPSLRPGGREQLEGPFRYGIALEFDRESNPVDRYQHLNNHNVCVSGIYYCVRDQHDVCVFPMISNPSFL